MAEVYPKNAAEFRHFVTDKLAVINTQLSDLPHIRATLLEFVAVKQSLEDLKEALIGNGQPGRLGFAEKEIRGLGDRLGEVRDKVNNQRGIVAMIATFLSIIVWSLFKGWEWVSAALMHKP